MEYTDIELKNENWKDIFGYDGAYQVSSLGRVRSLKFGKTRVLRSVKLKSGYLFVNLSKNGKEKMAYIHQLVARHFIENDNIFNTEVNHIDECKQNNRVSNLEWCDRQYNMTYNNIRYRRKLPKQFNCKRRKLKDIYDPNLSYDENIEIFRAHGVECCRQTLWNLRRDLGLINQRQHPKELV